MRNNKFFEKIFKSVEQQQSSAVEMPRINARQRNRSKRFTAHSATVYGLSGFLPGYVINADISNLRAAVEAYE